MCSQRLLSLFPSAKPSEILFLELCRHVPRHRTKRLFDRCQRVPHLRRLSWCQSLCIMKCGFLLFETSQTLHSMYIRRTLFSLRMHQSLTYSPNLEDLLPQSHLLFVFAMSSNVHAITGLSSSSTHSDVAQSHVFMYCQSLPSNPESSQTSSVTPALVGCATHTPGLFPDLKRRAGFDDCSAVEQQNPSKKQKGWEYSYSTFDISPVFIRNIGPQVRSFPRLMFIFIVFLMGIDNDFSIQIQDMHPALKEQYQKVYSCCKDVKVEWINRHRQNARHLANIDPPLLEYMFYNCCPAWPYCNSSP